MKVSWNWSVVIEWGRVRIFDGFRVFIEKLVLFNDYIVVLRLVVVWFVVVLLISELMVRRLNVWDMESVLIEFVWTILPLILLGFIAYPSMVLLYMYDEGKVVDLIVKVVGNQWY